jgi:hypothetical protein
MSQPQSQFDNWRIVVATSDGAEILVLKQDGLCSLPEVMLDRRQRLAWQINQQMQRDWQLPVLSIAPIQPVSNEHEAVARYHLVEVNPREASLPEGLRPVRITALARDQFRCAEDFDIVASVLAKDCDSESRCSSFGKLGWFESLSAWVREVTESHGLTWDGTFEQLHAAPRFSLIRFVTSPCALWFKAVGEPNTREFQITQALAALLPDFVPRIVAVRSECNGWLAKEAAGATLDTVHDDGFWISAADSLAKLQIASISHVDKLEAAGARPLHSLVSDASRGKFASAATKLFSTSRQRFRDPIADHFEEIALRARRVFERVIELNVPNTLGHLDMNAGNVLVSGEKCTYLDWAEACVGFPFLTLEYLLQGFRRVFGRQSHHESAVVKSYLSPWENRLSPGAVAEAWEHSSFVALYAYTARCIAVSETDLTNAPHLSKYVRSLLRRLNVEYRDSRTRADEVLQ